MILDTVYSPYPFMVGVSNSKLALSPRISGSLKKTLDYRLHLARNGAMIELPFNALRYSRELAGSFNLDATKPIGFAKYS